MRVSAGFVVSLLVGTLVAGCSSSRSGYASSPGSAGGRRLASVEPADVGLATPRTPETHGALDVPTILTPVPAGPVPKARAARPGPSFDRGT